MFLLTATYIGSKCNSAYRTRQKPLYNEFSLITVPCRENQHARQMVSSSYSSSSCSPVNPMVTMRLKYGVSILVCHVRCSSLPSCSVVHNSSLLVYYWSTSCMDDLCCVFPVYSNVVFWFAVCPRTFLIRGHTVASSWYEVYAVCNLYQFVEFRAFWGARYTASGAWNTLCREKRYVRPRSQKTAGTMAWCVSSPRSKYLVDRAEPGRAGRSRLLGVIIFSCVIGRGWKASSTFLTNLCRRSVFFSSILAATVQRWLLADQAVATVTR